MPAFWWVGLASSMVGHGPQGCRELDTTEANKHALGWERPLEKGKATHYSILACGTPWTDSPRGGKVLDTTE